MAASLQSDGATLRFQTAVESVDRVDGGTFRLNLSDNKSFGADVVLLATGRASTTWLSTQGRKLGLRFGNAEPLIGVRVETLTSRVRSMKDLGLDPKFKAEDTATKTHCMCFDGHVISCKCEDMVLVDGVSSGTPSGRTSFNILTRIPGLTRKAGRRMVHEILGEKRAQPIVQRMDDFQGGSSTSRLRLEAGKVKRSLVQSRPGNISDFLDVEALAKIYDFLDRLSALAPGISAPDNLVYAPVYEWFSPRVKWDADSWRTGVDGLFVTGDATGTSQGVVMASTSGLRAAFAIYEYLDGR